MGKRMNKLLILVLLMLICNPGFAQKTIKGKVFFGGTTEHGPATVVLKLNGLVQAYATTDNSNDYVLQTTKTGSFQLIVNSLNYKGQIFEIEF
jgi:hypothetical protein